jgi:hypothetical protein
MATPVLFFKDPEKDPDQDSRLDQSFCAYRDKGIYRDCRIFIENLWAQYQPYCPDKHFKSEFRKQFHQRMWEMRLACALLDSGHRLKKPEDFGPNKGSGPDICIEGDVPIWVEAVAVEAGKSVDRVLSEEERRDSTMRYERPELSWSGDPPSEESIILRCTSAMRDKIKKIREYKQCGIIKGTDPVVIAINIGIIDENAYFSTSPPPSVFIKSFFGIGEMHVSYVPDSGEGLRCWYPSRPAILRASGVPVSTQLFLGNEAKDISGVLGSCMSIHNAFYYQRHLPPEFVLVNNPNAIAPYAPGSIRLGRLGMEYRAEAGEIRHWDG